MKKLFIPLFCLLIALCTQVSAQNKGAQFKFDGGDVHDFGVVKRGPTAFHKFEFTNAGTEPIIVTDVTPSCGCTNVDWSRNPVLPGQKGFIQLSLKTEEQHGVFNKEVYIRSNAYVPNGEKRYTLYIKGNAVDDDSKSTESKKK
jgi:Protein of unknown function (DUF1573)